MARTQSLLILSCAAGALLSSACALPHGSMARPVQAAGEGAVMVAAGAMVPFAVAGGASGDGDSDFGAFSADNAIVIPAGSFDYALGDRHYIGVDVSLWSQAFAVDTDFDAFALFINPRWEYGVNENFSLTVDGNLAYLGSDDGGSPFLSPTFGVRAYIPTGFGGAVISQQVGTAFITLTLPGSLAYDVPIPVGEEAVLHIFPEVRWDPTLFFVGDASGFIAFFSGGLSFMLEI